MTEFTKCPECGSPNLDYHIETQWQSGWELDEEGKHQYDRPNPLRSWLHCIDGNHRFDGPHIHRPGTEGMTYAAEHEPGRYAFVRAGLKIASGATT